MHRPRRVDAAELHLDALPAAHVGDAIVPAALRNFEDQALQPFSCEPEIDVTARRLGDRRTVGHDDRFRDGLGDLWRSLTQSAGELEPCRACVFPMVGALRATELEV